MTQRLFDGINLPYSKFSTAFQIMYFDTEKKACAEKALQSLKQTKLVAHYTHQFATQAHHTGWETPTLISQYTQGLKKDVSLALIIASLSATELVEVTNLALKIDNELHGADDPTPAPAQQPTAPPATDPIAMDLLAFRGPLSEANRTRMMREGCCFRCGVQGHLSRDFSSKPKGKGSAAARIAESEEQLRQQAGGGSKAGEGGRANQSKNGGTQA
jgi:hypothetical protein